MGEPVFTTYLAFLGCCKKRSLIKNIDEGVWVIGGKKPQISSRGRKKAVILIKKGFSVFDVLATK